MRPETLDIAIPPVRPGTRWIGDEPAEAERLTAAGPVLVNFFELTQLNSIRALPYVNAWSAGYQDAGLVTLGVHSPRLAISASPGAVARACERLGVEHPVAVDSDHAIWHDYGCRGWPSLFLWGQGGALRWFHFGEGEYTATERAIRELVLETRPDAELPERVDPMRPSDEPGALVVPPSDEVFPGGSLKAPWEPTAEDPALEVEYEGAGGHAAADGSGEIAVAIDGSPPGSVRVDGPGLYELAAYPTSGRHEVALRPARGVRIWSVSFDPGPPGP
jgi:hypothetical protein